MGASYEADEAGGFRTRLYDIFYHDLPAPLPQSTALQAQPMPAVLKMPVENLEQDASRTAIQDYALRLVQDRADIDISGPDFNFVRSIRVFDVRYARQRESGRDDDCNRSAVVRLGTYGTQGDFSWTRSGVGALPSAHAGLERWGETCPNIFHRSVFVDWRDYEGNYGHEQVNY